MYTFNQLNERAKELAILNVEADISADFEPDFDSVLLKWALKLDHIGFRHAEVDFQLELSEAVFDSTQVDVKRLLEYLSKTGTQSQKRRAKQALKEKLYHDVSITLDLTERRELRYRKSYDSRELRAEGNISEELFKDIESLRYEFCRDILADLEAEERYQLEDEAEKLAKYDLYEFDAHGEILR